MEVGATIDDERLPGDEGGVLRRKEYYCAHDVLRMLIALQDARLARDFLKLFQLMGIREYAVGQGESGRHPIDPKQNPLPTTC